MRYFPVQYNNVFITGTGSFLPGEPVNNEQMDAFIAPINSRSGRIKRRILADNGIQTRYYAVNPDGTTRYSAAAMSAAAVNTCLQHAGLEISDITLLSTATSGGDVLMPGFGNMLQGELRAAPMETRSHHGICASGIAALKDAANQIDIGGHGRAMVSAVEFPSRLFKSSRFQSLDYDVDFDAHFLRWMLSDGAGACVLSDRPDASSGMALRVDWIHTKSFSGDYPVCMQMGYGHSNSALSFMDYSSFATAEKAGALLLRQDIRLLPQLFDVAVHEYAQLAQAGYVEPGNVDHFLSHYSSEKLGQVCDELMHKAGLGIARDKWFSNLIHCGNTGSASIFIMLAEFMRVRKLTPGEKIFCFIPESGRFTVSYIMLTVVKSGQESGMVVMRRKKASQLEITDTVPPPHDPELSTNVQIKQTLQSLASVWHDYRSSVWRTALVTKLLNGDFLLEDYLRWMENWIPQVQEGSKWMRAAVTDLPEDYAELRTLIEKHAGEESEDFKLLYEDYRLAGGRIDSFDKLRRNHGGEALNAYMHSLAAAHVPAGLLGGIYIIEGTGQRIVPVLLPRLRQQLKLPEQCYRFLKYHGENDINHLTRWLQAITMVLSVSDPEACRRHADSIIQTAKHVAALYLLQWELI